MVDDMVRVRRRSSIGARPNPATEAAVLAAAHDLLAEKGYGGFSIDELARRAGAGKPTIYRWWPTKADLFMAVYEQDTAAQLSDPHRNNLRADLVSFTRDLWGLWRLTPSGRTYRALVAEAQTSEAALAALRDRFLPARANVLRNMFARAAMRGDVAAADIEALIELYMGFNWLRLLTGRIEDDGEGIEHMAQLICSARGAGQHA